jgi:hypothetical protein
MDHLAIFRKRDFTPVGGVAFVHAEATRLFSGGCIIIQGLSGHARLLAQEKE